MFVCQWHFDIPFGKQGEVVRIMKAWFADSIKDSEFKRSKMNRILVGHIGSSPSHVIAEHLFESLSDYESAITSMSTPQFKKHAESLAPYVVPGSQRWEILKVVEG